MRRNTAEEQPRGKCPSPLPEDRSRVLRGGLQEEKRVHKRGPGCEAGRAEGVWEEEWLVFSWVGDPDHQ